MCARRPWPGTRACIRAMRSKPTRPRGSAGDQAHPDHQRAWQRLEALQATLRRVPGHIAASTLRAVQADRRRVLRGIGVVASGGALAYLSWQADDAQGGWRAWLADHRTGTGEQQSVELADGSKLLLNTRTSVDVAMNALRRVVRLREGEILVETAKHRGLRVDAQADLRPFMIETDHGRIVALGTRFTVRRDGERTAVTVLEDAVEIRASEAPRPGRRAARRPAGRLHAWPHRHAPAGRPRFRRMGAGQPRGERLAAGRRGGRAVALSPWPAGLRPGGGRPPRVGRIPRSRTPTRHWR
jgi:transmembrane sensor